MPSLPVSAAALASVLLLAHAPAASAGFSRADWSNPAQAGSALWIKNRRLQAVTLDSLYVRTLGFRGFSEVEFNAGARRVGFRVQGNPLGRWARLIPRPGQARLRVRARDSLMITGFECGAQLRAAGEARRPAEEFVLDWMVVDDRGERDQVKIIQMTPDYRIEEPVQAMGADPDGE